MSEPRITARAAHGSKPNGRVTRIVIHDTEGGNGFPGSSAAGQALGTARYFQSPRAGGSAHYCVDVTTEVHCVPDDVQAWHAPPNGGSVGIEICGKAAYTREQWLSPQVWPAVQRAARRTAELCDRFSLPKVALSTSEVRAGKHGITGHVNVAQAFHQSDHSDPGPNFPWEEFMAEVRGDGGNVTLSPGKATGTAGTQSAPARSDVARGWRRKDKPYLVDSGTIKQPIDVTVLNAALKADAAAADGVKGHSGPVADEIVRVTLVALARVGLVSWDYQARGIAGTAAQDALDTYRHWVGPSRGWTEADMTGTVGKATLDMLFYDAGINAAVVEG